ELELRSQQLRIRIDERRPITLEQIRRRQLAVPLRQLRLIVEQLQMARRAGHEQIDDALGLRCEVRRLRCQRTCRRFSGNSRRSHQFGQSRRAQTNAAFLQEPPAHELRRITAAIKMRLAMHWYYK